MCRRRWRKFRLRRHGCAHEIAGAGFVEFINHLLRPAALESNDDGIAARPALLLAVDRRSMLWIMFVNLAGRENSLVWR